MKLIGKGLVKTVFLKATFLGLSLATFCLSVFLGVYTVGTYYATHEKTIFKKVK